MFGCKISRPNTRGQPQSKSFQNRSRWQSGQTLHMYVDLRPRSNRSNSPVGFSQLPGGRAPAWVIIPRDIKDKLYGSHMIWLHGIAYATARFVLLSLDVGSMVMWASMHSTYLQHTRFANQIILVLKLKFWKWILTRPKAKHLRVLALDAYLAVSFSSKSPAWQDLIG